MRHLDAAPGTRFGGRHRQASRVAEALAAKACGYVGTVPAGNLEPITPQPDQPSLVRIRLLGLGLAARSRATERVEHSVRGVHDGLDRGSPNTSSDERLLTEPADLVLV
jgi:hypothetical protein